MLPIVPPGNAKPHYTPCFQRLRTKRGNQAGDIPSSGDIRANLTHRTCRKTFSHYGQFSSPTGSDFIAIVFFSGFEIGGKIAAQDGAYVPRTCFESYPGKHLW